MAGEPADIMPVYLDGSRLHIIEAHQKIDDSCLSASGRSYDRNTLTGTHGKVQSRIRGFSGT